MPISSTLGAGAGNAVRIAEDVSGFRVAAITKVRGRRGLRV